MEINIFRFMEIKTNVVVLLITVLLMSERLVTGIGIPVDQLVYIVSGAHLKWSKPGDRPRATESGEYVARNVVPARMAMKHDGGIYFALPRFRTGVPFTLGVIKYDSCLSTIEPSISPYPCTGSHLSLAKPNNWTMVNVVDVYIDDGGTLWALDVGKVDILNKSTVIRPPMVFAFDTETNEMIRAIDLSRATTSASCLQSIVVDHSATAGLLVYISDTGYGKIIVYKVACDQSFKVHVPVGQRGRQDVIYMALTEVDVIPPIGGSGKTRHRRLYVTYYSARDMMFVPVHAIDETTESLGTVSVGHKHCKITVLGTDRESTIYFRTANTGNDVYSWNVNDLFLPKNFRFVQRGPRARTPVMVTVGFHGYMWSMANNFVDFLASDLGCLGVSTRIETLQTCIFEDGEEDERCRPAVPFKCNSCDGPSMASSTSSTSSTGITTTGKN